MEIQKSSICAKGLCVTVFGKEAEAINTIVLFTVAVVALSVLYKTLK